MDFLLLSVYLGLGVLTAILARRFLEFKDEKVLAALFLVVPLVAMLGTGRLSKVSAFGVEATIEKVRSEKVADTPLGSQKLETIASLVTAQAGSGTVTMAEAFFGVQKRIVVLDMDADPLTLLQPLPDFQLQVPDQCYANITQPEEKARVGQIVQASHTLGAILQVALQVDSFAGVAVVQGGNLKAYFAPQRFYDVIGLRLWHWHRGIVPSQVPCSLVSSLSQSLVWELLSDIQAAPRLSDPYELIPDRSTVGDLLQRLDNNSALTLALTDPKGAFKGVVNRTDVAMSVLARLVGPK